LELGISQNICQVWPWIESLCSLSASQVARITKGISYQHLHLFFGYPFHCSLATAQSWEHRSTRSQWKQDRFTYFQQVFEQSETHWIKPVSVKILHYGSRNLSSISKNCLGPFLHMRICTFQP
jgi:hypothetical protein